MFTKTSIVQRNTQKQPKYGTSNLPMQVVELVLKMMIFCDLLTHTDPIIVVF